MFYDHVKHIIYFRIFQLYDNCLHCGRRKLVIPLGETHGRQLAVIPSHSMMRL